MRKELKNRFTMFKTVAAWLKSKTSELTGLPNLPSVQEHLENQIKVIDELDSQTGQTTKGATSAKSSTRKELEDALILLVTQLKNVAVFSNNLVLLHEIDFKDRQVRTMTELMLVSRGGYILQKAQANQAAVDSGITPELLSKTEQLLAEYAGLKTAPRQIIIGSVDVNERLEAEMEATRDLIKNKLDLIMKRIQFDKSTLYGQYKSARVIVDR